MTPPPSELFWKFICFGCVRHPSLRISPQTDTGDSLRRVSCCLQPPTTRLFPVEKIFLSAKIILARWAEILNSDLHQVPGVKNCDDIWFDIDIPFFLKGLDFALSLSIYFLPDDLKSSVNGCPWLKTLLKMLGGEVGSSFQQNLFSQQRHLSNLTVRNANENVGTYGNKTPRKNRTKFSPFQVDQQGHKIIILNLASDGYKYKNKYI